MSDIVVITQGGETAEHDRRRAALSMAAAFFLHAAAIGAVTLIVAMNPQPAPLPPVSVSLLLASSPLVSQGSAAAATSDAPAAVAAPLSPKSGATTPKGGGADGFVIPTPRAQSPGSTTSGATGSGFRAAGGTTGGAASLPAVQSPVPGATLPAAQSGGGSGTGAASTQHAGQGVAVSDPSAGTTRGSLDLSGLDKALAGGTTGGSGAASGATGGTTGATTGGGTSGSASGSSVGPDFSVVFDQPDVTKGRKLVREDRPKVPPWVGEQGLTLSVTVSFTLRADGVLSGVSLDKSSGYADVDAAVVEAVRRWQFTAAKGAAPAKGIITHKIMSQ